MWGTPVPPDGWLELNGQLFNPSGNPILASLYPSGQVPDFRGYFPRGWDNGAGIDPDNRAILSVQGDAIRNIKVSLILEAPPTGGKVYLVAMAGLTRLTLVRLTMHQSLRLMHQE
nr:phage tail protein [Pectobacterium sp. PL152]